MSAPQPCSLCNIRVKTEGYDICAFCLEKQAHTPITQALKDYDESRKQFTTGAVRSKDADDVRFDLITPIGIRRLAETYAEGAKKYGDNNWQKGIPAGECINHALKHINQWLSGDTSEDHLAHAAWNLFAVMHYEEKLPSMLKDLAYRKVHNEPQDTTSTMAGYHASSANKING